MTFKQENDIANISDWFLEAKPNATPEDTQTQVGCHFEEVHEMLQELLTITPETNLLIAKAKLAIHELAEHLKNTKEVVIVIDNHTNFIDALADQVVTATGVATFLDYDFVGAVDEVNRSNWSKFVNDKAILHKNGKIAKGPNYFKANLKEYLPVKFR